MVRPRLLDLFCGAGGASEGYRRAGFQVVGVDVVPQTNHQGGHFKAADAMSLPLEWMRSFDAVHASPPCQSYSVLAKRTGKGGEWPRLIEPVRALLDEVGRPYVIENVVGAPLLEPVVLCGTMFPGLRVIRHRLFETSFPLEAPPHPPGKHPLCHTLDKRKAHYGRTDEWKAFVQVNGGGNCSVAAARDAMGIGWMTKAELNQAIPPAYTEYVGKALMEVV